MQESRVIHLNKELQVVGHAVNRFHEGNRKSGSNRQQIRANPFSFFRRGFYQGQIIARTIQLDSRNKPILRYVIAYSEYCIVAERSNNGITRIITITPNHSNKAKHVKKPPSKGKRYVFTEDEIHVDESVYDY